jgi:hypothetical protein
VWIRPVAAGRREEKREDLTLVFAVKTLSRGEFFAWILFLPATLPAKRENGHEVE